MFMYKFLGIKCGPTDRALFKQCHVIKVLLLTANLDLMEPPHAFASYPAEQSGVEEVCWKRLACLAVKEVYTG